MVTFRSKRREIVGSLRRCTTDPPKAAPALDDVAQWITVALREIHTLRREKNDLEEKVSSGRTKWALDMIKVADALDAHLGEAEGQQAELNERGQRFLAGMQASRRVLRDAMKRNGVQPWVVSGVFNPDLHTVSDTEPRQDVPEGTIVQILVQGYLLEGEPLRNPEVKVAIAVE